MSLDPRTTDFLFLMSLDPLDPDFLFLMSPVAFFALLAFLEWAFRAWARRARSARTPGSRVTRGLSDSDRALRQAALHLGRERERAIADLGADWVLHPDHKRGEK